jgi:hypothetical protein
MKEMYFDGCELEIDGIRKFWLWGEEVVTFGVDDDD